MKNNHIVCPNCGHLYEIQDFAGIYFVPVFHITCRNCYADSPIIKRDCIQAITIFFLITVLTTFGAIFITSQATNNEILIFAAFVAGIVIGGMIGFRSCAEILKKSIKSKGWANKTISLGE